LLEVAGELVPRVAQEEPVGGVPVVVDRGGRRVGGRLGLAAVDDQRQAEDQRDRDDHREQRSTLEADALALALLRKFGCSLGRRTAIHGVQGYRRRSGVGRRAGPLAIRSQEPLRLAISRW